jgi:hypothetical protein
MKNKLLSQNAVTHFFYSMCLMLLCTNLSWGQEQTIGSFSYMDGGFEGQITGDLQSFASTTSTTTWTRDASSTVTPANGYSKIINDLTARTGNKYAKGIIDNTGQAQKALISPNTNVAGAFPASGSTYIVQYYIRKSNSNKLDSAIGSGGNTSPIAPYVILTSSNTGWQKVCVLVTSSGQITNPVAPATPAYQTFVSPGRLKAPAATVVTYEMDDVVVYAGTTLSDVDITEPDAASGGAVAGTTVSWTASPNVDGGGYMVVRYASNPNLDNDPNVNGIYGVGNTITNGTGSLVGTVVYTGIGTSFTDNVAGSVSGSDYYKIYAVDKAFNYSTEIKATAVVSTTPTITSSKETLTGFNYTGVGPSASQSFVVSGSILTNNLVVSTESTDFELSQDNFATAGVSSISLSAPTVAATIISVRLKANLLGGSKSATVTIASAGANTLPDLSLSGSATNVFYYNGSGLLLSNTSWGVNTDGSGANPADVTATYTNFVIANGNATTADAAWTLGTGSKVIVGNGSAVSLTVADTFPITGTIDAAANGSVVWQHVLASPTFGTLDNDSEVHFQPAVNAFYGLGNGTAYGKLFIDGSGKVSVSAALSTVTVKTSLAVVSGSTLDFPVTNTHSITINTNASATIDGTIRAGKQGGLFGTVAGGATTTTVSILFVDATPNFTLGASSLVDYYRPNATQTVSLLPTGVNYANLTLSETGNTDGLCVKSIPGPITVSVGVLTLNLATIATSKTLNACNISLVNGATKTITAGAFDCEPLLGINDVEFANNTIAFYPNPAQEVLNVSSANNITKIEVYDLLGKKVASNNNAKNVNVAALGKGVYVVKVVQENGSVVAKRFIKQ